MPFSSEFERWDALVAENVLVNSTMGRDIHGREALKSWAAQFVNALQSRVWWMNLKGSMLEMVAFLHGVPGGNMQKYSWDYSRPDEKEHPLKHTHCKGRQGRAVGC